MILTIDIGNSRIKWALWRADEIIVRVATFYEIEKSSEAFDWLLADVNRALQDVSSKNQSGAVHSSAGHFSIDRLSRVCAVCVAGSIVENSLNTWVKQHWQLSVEYLKTQKQYGNIIHAYDEPSQHGIDRWAGIVAACNKYSDRSICVIGAGTAITFDLIKHNDYKDDSAENHNEPPHHYRYQHLGGYILPSFVSMHNALSADTVKTSSVPNIEYNKTGVPNNTSDAVNQGLHLLLQAGVRKLCDHAKERLGEPVRIVVTGGFAPVILNYPDMPVMKYEPDLVMDGVYEMIRPQRVKLRDKNQKTTQQKKAVSQKTKQQKTKLKKKKEGM